MIIAYVVRLYFIIEHYYGITREKYDSSIAIFDICNI